MVCDECNADNFFRSTAESFLSHKPTTVNMDHLNTSELTIR